MTHKFFLALTLWFGFAHGMPAFAGDDIVIENGSSTILRVWSMADFEDENTGCKTLVVLASDKEVTRISNEIRNAKDPSSFTVHLSGSKVRLRLRPMDQDHLVGRVIGTGRRVVVMTRRYADANGFYNFY